MTINKSAILIKKLGNDEIWIYPITTSENVLHNNDQLDELIAAIQTSITSLSDTSVKTSQITVSREITAAGYVSDARAIANIEGRLSDIEDQNLVTSDSSRQIHVSTQEPTAQDGNNGDIWIVYDA